MGIDNPIFGLTMSSHIPDIVSSGVARNLRQGVCKVVVPLPSLPFPSPPLSLPSSLPLPPPSP